MASRTSGAAPGPPPTSQTRGPGLTRPASYAGTAVVPPPVHGGAAVPAHYLCGRQPARLVTQLPSSARRSAVSEPGCGAYATIVWSGAAGIVRVSNGRVTSVSFPNYAVYGATKAAVTCLSQALRSEFGPRDVRVTSIEPGFVESELRTHIGDAELARQVEGMLDEVGALSAEELADLVVYVTSRPRRVNLRQIVALPTRQV
ncbi:hypothetical protein CA983_26430 [Streptomyces swartbergensis]|uniref:Short-chain dehydrogenase n=1 Tax=Streptomyces swartbergensis TaxID=487165 RepID=A0A243RYG7_9ACTN|nr:hypothetical protein CA983_26430 [Streptomyces swartbergensis]